MAKKCMSFHFYPPNQLVLGTMTALKIPFNHPELHKIPKFLDCLSATRQASGFATSFPSLFSYTVN